MIRLQILSGRQAGQFFLARRFPFRVGRAAEADLQSAESGVWDDHFRIDYRAGEGFSLIPASTCRTLLNASQVEAPERLPNGAEITAGSLRLRFALADPPPRGLFLREATTWIVLALVAALECWLIVRLAP